MFPPALLLFPPGVWVFPLPSRDPGETPGYRGKHRGTIRGSGETPRGSLRHMGLSPAIWVFPPALLAFPPGVWVFPLPSRDPGETPESRNEVVSGNVSFLEEKGYFFGFAIRGIEVKNTPLYKNAPPCYYTVWSPI